MKKAIAKLTACLLLALTIFMPLAGSSKVLAASTKTITVYVTQSFYGTSDEIGMQLQAYMTSHPTYDYYDGQYRGTLYFSGLSLESSSSNYAVYKFAYTGEVTEIVVQKYVTVSVYNSFVGTDSEISAQLQNYINSHLTYYYDDNSYRGTLSFSGIKLVTQTTLSPGIYLFTFEFKYSGYVTKY